MLSQRYFELFVTIWEKKGSRCPMEGLAGPGTYGNVINRKYSKFPDRKKKFGSKIFFHHGEKLF